MSKIYAFLATVCFLIISLTINAQPTFYFSPSNQTPDLGEQITVDVIVDGFTDITSYQYSVNWNISHLSYVSISNFNAQLGLNAGNFGTTMTGNGKLSTLWSDPLANPQSLPDGAVLFTITLDVVATDPVSTDVQFTGNPTSIEVTQDTGGGIMDITDSVIFIDITIEIAGGGGGGGPLCNFNGFGMVVESDSVGTGEQVCLDVAVCNFSEITSMQYTMQFDPALLQFDNVQNFNLPNLAAGNFGTTMINNGFVTVSWNDPMGQGVTVTDETVIYSICFTAIGAGGSVDFVQINGNLAPIEITDVNSGGSNIGLESIDGEVTITGDLSNAVTVNATCEEGETGDTVYVDVTVQNFTNMLGLQFSMGWDPAIIQFHETQWTGELPGTPLFNTTLPLTDAGKLSFLWTDPNVSGVTVSDNTVIFRVAYILVGSGSESSTVSFTGDPVAIEATQDVGGNPEVVPLVTNSGCVDISQNNDPGFFGLVLSDEFGCTNDTIEVEVSVENFEDVISMQYDVQWDDAHLGFIDVTGFNLSGLSVGQFNQVNVNTIRIAWVEPLLSPQTLTDGTVIYKMRFEVLGVDSTTSNIEFLDNPPTNIVEFSQDPGGIIANYNLTNAIETVDCGGTNSQLVVTDTLITNVLCSGDSTGAIDITVTGGNGNYSYEWSNGAMIEDPSDLAVGTYTVTITAGVAFVVETYTVSQPSELSLSDNVTNETGSNMDGAIDITVSGGTPNFTYAWSNGATSQDISGLSQGSYSVTVTDQNGCLISETYIIAGAMALSSEVTDVSCSGSNDGAISVTLAGGASPYTYEWSLPLTGNTPDQTDLFAGTYSVTVTDNNGAMIVSSIVVNGPDAITVLQANINDETGNGCNGSIDLTVIGGTVPYTYQWSNGATSEDLSNLCKGNYNVTIVDANGCIFLSSIYGVLPPPLIVANSNKEDVSCNGESDGSLCVSPLGGCEPYTVSIPSLGVPTVTILNGGEACFEDLPAGNHNVIIQDSGNPLSVIVHFVQIGQPDPIMIGVDNIINNTDPTCNNPNGGIDISVSGGTTPYSYAWSNGSTLADPIGLCHTAPINPYTVTITDANGCTQISSVITLELGLFITVDEVNDVCGDCDGSASISVTGGATPYSYDWGGADPNSLCAGTYGVTVTDAQGNTVDMQNITVNAPASPLSVTSDIVDHPNGTNNDGAISINVSGGWGGYTYMWSNGATTQNIAGLSEGSYTVTVTDNNGCVVFWQQNLVAEGLVLDFTIETPLCNGDENGLIEVFVTGGSGDYTYEWSPSAVSQSSLAFGLPAGSYSVTVTDANNMNLSASQTIPLSQPDPLIINIITTPSTGGASGSLEADVVGGTEPYSYLWNDDNTQVTQTAVNLPTGEFAVRVEDANGCVEIAQGEVVQGGECFSSKELLSYNGNGKNTEFIIRCAEQFDNSLQIFNRWGQLVYKATNYDNTWNAVDESGQDVPAGGYYFVFEYEDGGKVNRVKGSITILR